jgi:hypothetical protein
VEADRELILEGARSIREGLWYMASYAQDAAEALDSRIEDKDLDGLFTEVPWVAGVSKRYDRELRPP